MDLIKSNKNRAIAVRIVFYAMMLINIISAYSNYMQLDLLEQLNQGVSFSDETLNANDSRQQQVAIVFLLFVIASIVAFIMWLYRSYKNLHAINSPGLHYTAGWAIGGWFVPFLNLVRPYQIVSEVWNETQRYIKPDGEKHQIETKTLVGFWWGFWLADNFVSNISGRQTFSANSVDDYITSTVLSIVSDCLGMIAMIFTLLLVNKMKIFEDNLFGYVQSQPKPTNTEQPSII